MKTICYLLRLFSLLVPPASREDWFQKWKAEFHYALEANRARQRDKTWGYLRCAGAAVDALKLRMRHV